MPTEILIDEAYAVEESTAKITVSFTDEDDQAVIPNTINWSLTDVNGTEINGRTDVVVSSPASTITLGLSGDDLAIQAGETGDYVYRVFTVKATYNSSLGADLPLNDSLKFGLKNLVAVT
jgi:hypothetical protein